MTDDEMLTEYTKALLMATEALSDIINKCRIHGAVPGSDGRQVWHDDEAGAVARKARDAIDDFMRNKHDLR